MSTIRRVSLWLLALALSIPTPAFALRAPLGLRRMLSGRTSWLRLEGAKLGQLSRSFTPT